MEEKKKVRPQSHKVGGGGAGGGSYPNSYMENEVKKIYILFLEYLFTFFSLG